MNTKTAVEILGLHEANLSEKSIKSAYRKLAIENHPDLFPNDTKRETRMKEADTNPYDIDINIKYQKKY